MKEFITFGKNWGIKNNIILTTKKSNNYPLNRIISDCSCMVLSKLKAIYFFS